MVLILEHDLMLRELMLESLASKGIPCKSTPSYNSALEILQHNPNRFSCIIADRTLPDGDGLALILHARRLNPDLPAILTCGYHNPPETTEQIHFLPKPFSMEKLATTVSRYCLASAAEEQPSPHQA